MLPNLHKTPIGSLADCLDAWGRQAQLKNEFIADAIVSAHDATNGPLRSRIYFEPSSNEERRLSTNCARIFRWFDERKENNLLSVNFLPSILIAMPEEYREAWLNEYLRPLGLGVRSLESGDGTGLNMMDVCELASIDAQALQAVADAVANPTVENLDAALQHTARAAQKKARIVRMLEGAKKSVIRATSATKSVIGKLFRGSDSRASSEK